MKELSDFYQIFWNFQIRFLFGMGWEIPVNNMFSLFKNYTATACIEHFEIL